MVKFLSSVRLPEVVSLDGSSPIHRKYFSGKKNEQKLILKKQSVWFFCKT